MKIQFCGAAQTVTGSAHLLTLDNGFTMLLDCGLYQGDEEAMEDFNKRWLFRPEEIDTLILSHAHIDHSGRIPKLYKDGFRGTIHATHATRSLCSIMLLDSAKIQQSDAKWENKRRQRQGKRANVEPLYDMEHARKCMDLFHTYSYNEWIQIHPDVDLMFTDAGHILGSATVTLRIREDGKEVIFGFTGDIGRPNRPILRDPQPMPAADYLISESTYGDRSHESAPDEKDHLLKIIKETCIEKQGKLIIPAFSVGRTQEIVYMMDQMVTDGILPHIPVFVDSPLAVNATTVFGSHPECYDDELNAYLLEDDNPFGFNSLIYIRSAEMSKSLNTMNRPAIIISAAGMMNAGRIRHHMHNNLDNPKNTFLIVGFCAPNTAGALIKSGVDQIKIFGDWIPIRADIEIMDSFSAHGDKLEMLDFLGNHRYKCKRLYLVHGEEAAQESFKQDLETFGFQNVHIPSLGKAYTLTDHKKN